MSEHAGTATTEALYGPLTKSIDIEQTSMLLSLAHELGSVAAFREEGLARLPQTSRVRRQEVIRLTLRKFLVTENGRIVVTPFLRVMAAPTVAPTLKRDLLFIQYLRSTPLVWEAVVEVVLPRAEGANSMTNRVSARAIQVQDWNAFLLRRLHTYTDSTLARTRSHLTAHLTKFGVLEAERVEGDAIAKRFYARFTEPDPRAFLFGLVMEFNDHGWTSRSLDWVITHSWTRVGFCTRPTYARFAVEQGEHWGVVAREFFGSQRQVTLRGPNPIERVVGLIIGG
jgi:hypothetical protein